MVNYVLVCRSHSSKKSLPVMPSTISKSQALRFRLFFTIIISSMLGGLLLWQFYHGGIPSHHLLADKSLPKISNAWGALVIPIVTWILLWLTQRRVFGPAPSILFPRQVVLSFLSALVFGLCLGLSIAYGFKAFSGNVPAILFVLALLFPVYRAEYFLGFILGLTYFIGGVLPVMVGFVFLLLAAAVHLLLRPLLMKLVALVKS
jgi:hypothetical protein